MPRQVPEDHDYMTAIQELSKNLSRRIKTQWIKGHQDERTPYADLTRDAKLNVDVDELATLHQASKRQLPTEFSPHLSEQKITVVINGKRYPSQINAQIRYHINGSNLKQYLATKQGWTEDTGHKIDLHTFGVHFRRLTMGKKVQHMKFIYDLQPVGRRKGQISKNDSDSATQCPCCRIEIENQYHLLHCRHNPKRTTSLAAFYKEVQRAQAGSKFGRIIADAFEQWFEDPASTPSMENTRDPTLDHNTLFTSEYVSQIKAAFTHQREIGWMNAARGFLAKAWFQVACTQLQIPGGPNGEVTHTCRHDGHQRTYQVVRALHTLVTSLWQGRNEELHKQDKDTEAVQRTVIDAEIALLHCEPSALPAEDRHYCNHSLEHILRKPPTYKRRWLFRVRAARERDKQDQTRQHRITAFFNRAPTIQPQNTAQPSTPSRPAVPQAHLHRRPISTNQKLLTEFFRARAPNHTTNNSPFISPSPVD